MMFKEILSNEQGACQGKAEIVFSIHIYEDEELSKALEVIDKYKNAACEQLNHNPLDSEWHMFDFKLKGDNKLTITVKDGMIG